MGFLRSQASVHNMLMFCLINPVMKCVLSMLPWGDSFLDNYQVPSNVLYLVE